MPTLLSVEEVRKHVESDLHDDALERIVEAADQEIIDRLGALATKTEVLPGGEPVLVLPRKASAISSIVERIVDTDYALVAADYFLRDDGYIIERRDLGTYPSYLWRGSVTVVFTPVDETARRKQLLVNLVKMETEFTGNQSDSLGDASKTGLSYTKTKDELFAPFHRINRRMPLA